MRWPFRSRHRGLARHSVLVMEQRISLITLGVKDLARARAFYDALGWRDAQQPDDQVCFYQAGGIVFGLWTALGGHGELVSTPAEIRPALERAFSSGMPAVVNALTDPAVAYPRRSNLA